MHIIFYICHYSMVSKIMKFQTVEFKLYIYYFLQILISKQRLIEFKRNGSPENRTTEAHRQQLRPLWLVLGQTGRLGMHRSWGVSLQLRKGPPVASKSGRRTGESAGTDSWRAGKGWRKKTADASGE